ncbi:ParB N-terminal domain-containing protein [uncultured Roseobacter sp.]|uniref:ParB/RepB/Spo0J family partition protein n=1 Tax=uncultured Roseobacter sp. TaxID=114847 RepID=UPI0026117B74|nr:ParB N-terminal domain-containing protein [uncultured Roseobacter sp.]
MAKRKRLSPAARAAEAPAPETKAALGWVGHGARRAPIADVSGDAAQHSAFEEVAEELRRARAEGRMVLRLPLTAVEAGHLVRDRIAADAEEMEVLKDSLRDRGQQTPIEVVELAPGRYGLISGWRRLAALEALSAENAEAFGTVQALVRAPEGAAEAYRAMVEENEIRADLSFYERARIAVQATERGVYPDVRAAVRSLFAAARAPKRSKILTFTALVEALDAVLRFPTAIPEKLGLPLATALQADPAFARRLAQALKAADPQEAAAERKVLERVLKGQASAPATPGAARPESIAPGLALSATPGRVVLSGKAVDAALLADLRDWLATRNEHP